MLIERIKRIKNIGGYENAGNGQIQLKPYTFIYAANTYGKTTFCDIIRSLKTNDVSIINNRKRVGMKNSDKCEVSFTVNKLNIDYDGACWSVPDSVDIRENLQIFDINFVNENVFTNFNIEHRNKENFTSFVLGTRGVELIQRLATLEETLTIKEQDYKTKKILLEKQLKTITFEEIKKVKYNENFKDFECLIISAQKAIDDLQKQREEIDQIKEIKGIDKWCFNFDKIFILVKAIREILEKKYAIDLSLLKNEIEKIRKDNPTLTEGWLKDGVKNSKGQSVCPFCGNETTQNMRVNIIMQYYSEEVVKIIDEIEKLQKDIDRELQEILVGNALLKIQQQATKVLPYCDLETDKKEDFFILLQSAIEQVEKINQNISFIKQELASNLQLKLSSITETEFPISQTTSFLGGLTKLLETKEKINEKIEEYNKIFIRYRDKLTEDFINEKVLILQKELNDNNFILTRGMYNEHIEELNQINEHILELKKLIKTTKSQIDIQQDEFLNKYFEEIQNIFSRLGGEHYRIEREVTPRGKKKVYGVKIYFKDKLVDETKYCLSESDRRALALSVFLAKIKLDNNPNQIIILDDPITSFDENRMRLFISIINELNNKAFCQIIILMHYENFFRLITRITQDKTLIKIMRSGDNHFFEEIFDDNDIFKNEYERQLNKIIRFINAEITDIAENDVRIYFEKYLHQYYAYEISKDATLPAGRLHDFVVNLERQSLISSEIKEDLLIKLRFLNDSSHTFTDYTEEEKRSFIKEAYLSLHQMRK